MALEIDTGTCKESRPIHGLMEDKDNGGKPLQGVVLCCTALPQDVRVSRMTNYGWW